MDDFAAGVLVSSLAAQDDLTAPIIAAGGSLLSSTEEEVWQTSLVFSPASSAVSAPWMHWPLDLADLSAGDHPPAPWC